MSKQDEDVEALVRNFIDESPELKNIRPTRLKMSLFAIVITLSTCQLLSTICNAAKVNCIDLIATFFSSTRIGLYIYIALILLTLFVVCLLHFHYNQKHPMSFVLLVNFTLLFGFNSGVLYAFVTGKVVTEAVIAATVVYISFTIYTVCVVMNRGLSFGYRTPFLFSIAIILVMYIIFQILFPMGKISDLLYSGLIATIFSTYIVFVYKTLSLLLLEAPLA